MGGSGPVRENEEREKAVVMHLKADNAQQKGDQIEIRTIPQRQKEKGVVERDRQMRDKESAEQEHAHAIFPVKTLGRPELQTHGLLHSFAGRQPEIHALLRSRSAIAGCNMTKASVRFLQERVRVIVERMGEFQQELAFPVG